MNVRLLALTLLIAATAAIIRKFWWAYPAAMAAIHIKNGVGNIRTQGPGGCTTIECAMQIP